MAVATTTVAAIRDAQITAIKALAPTAHSELRYTYAPDELDVPLADFREWSEEHLDACDRWYVLEYRDETPLDVTNAEAELCQVQCELVMAYPHDFYGDRVQGVADIHDTIREDQVQILRAIGYRGAANYASGQRAVSEETSTIEPGDGVSFGVCSYTVTYYRS